VSITIDGVPFVGMLRTPDEEGMDRYRDCPITQSWRDITARGEDPWCITYGFLKHKGWYVLRHDPCHFGFSTGDSVLYPDLLEFLVHNPDFIREAKQLFEEHGRAEAYPELYEAVQRL
jgi:hypothetical protein